jgi:hypothetical protein
MINASWKSSTIASKQKADPHMSKVKSGYDVLNVMREVLEMAAMQIESGVPETKDYVLSRLRELIDLPAPQIPSVGEVVLPTDLRPRLDNVVAEIQGLIRDGFKCDDEDETFLLDLHTRLAKADQPMDERGLFEDTYGLSYIVEYDSETNLYREVVRSGDSEALTELTNLRWKVWQDRAALPQRNVTVSGDVRTFEEGIRRASDLVRMVAANRETPEVVREMEDLALSIMDEAPRYKTRWRVVSQLSSELRQTRHDLDKAQAQLLASGWTPPA